MISMNQLSKEAIEAIENDVNYLETVVQPSFMYGAKTALTNPEIFEKAGLISLQDALGFAEWVQYEAIRYEGDWIYDFQLYTTFELFQIYKQQKP